MSKQLIAMSGELEFGALVDALPLGIVVHRDRRILYANQVVLAALGLDRLDQLLGRDPVEFLPAEDRAKHADRIAAVARGESIQPAAARLTTRDGRSFAIEVGGFLVEFGGQPAMVTVVRDVTAEREAQAALAESEARKKAILGAALEAIVTMDEKGRIAGFNPAAEKIFGYARADVLGKPVADLLIPLALREAHRSGLERYLATGLGTLIGKRAEYTALRAGGEEFPIELTVVRLDGGPPRFTAFIRDLTERKELERAQAQSNVLHQENCRIQEVNRLKSEFLANVSHELRTPLNAILGFADVLSAGGMGPLAEEQREALGHILSSGSHLLRLINDVLDLARLESGRIEFHPEPVELRVAIAEVISILRPAATRKEIAIDTVLDPEVQLVVVDPARLRQVIYSYLSNAVKFTGPGGRVTVRTLADGPNRFRIEVEDRGIGMRPEETSRLFTAFHQLDSGLSKNYPGTGMGLALVRRIVEAQGGRVGARSEPGKGSTFHAILPRESIVGARPETAAT